MHPIRVLAISGSLRKDALTTQLIQALPALAPNEMDISLFPLHDIPLYNQDVEDVGFPAPVQALRDAVTASDGLIFATPEYNGALSGVLKNSIDWASRKGLLRQRPAVAISGSPGALGATKAQQSLRAVLTHMGMYVLPRPAIAVPHLDAKLVNGTFTDPDTVKFITGWLELFRNWIVQLNK